MEAFRRAWMATLASLAERIEAGADLPDAASLEGLYEASLPTLPEVDAVLETLSARLLTDAGRDGQDVLRASLKTVASYTAGWIEGGGVALALLRDLPDPLTAPAIHRALSERMAFVVERVELAVRGWLGDAETPGHVTRAGAPDAGVRSDTAFRSERLGQLLVRASALGVRVRNAPELPSDGYLRKLALQLDDVERKRAEQTRDAPERAGRLRSLLLLADRLKVRVKEVPADPTAAWLDKMETKLAEVAARKGLSLDGEPRTGPFDRPDVATDAGVFDREGAITSEEPRPVPMGPRARLAVLVERAESAGFDLGRLPNDPSGEWLDDMEGRLDAAIAQRREDRQAERHRLEHERRARITRIVSRAAELGLDLGPIPPLPTDDWIERVEQRLSTQAFATPGSASPISVERFDEPSDHDELPAEDSVPTDLKAFLVFEEGTVQERIWPVDTGAVTLGRGRGNVVQIRDDAGVSRRHATLQREDDTYVLRDEGSTKGTLVDGEPVTETVLAGGERITLGDTHFVFRLR
jgi:hypothetical protein